MHTPESVTNRILVDIVAQGLLDQASAEEVTTALTKDTRISWDSLINAQIKNEKGSTHEA